MKKFISVFLNILMLISCIPFAFASVNGVTVTSSTPVVISETATEQEKFAAERLSYYLGQVFGTEPEITTVNADKCILVGTAAGCDTSALEENGYLITAKNGCVQIEGTGIRGTIQGVYRFLEDFADVHVYTSTLTVTPDADEITVPADTDITYAPFFEYTDTDWLSPQDPEYCIANGIDGGLYRTITNEQGGMVRYLSGSCHTMTGQFCSSAKYFNEHPEYFALHDGVRNGSELCLTNPDTLKIVTQEVLDMLASKYVDDGSLQIISVSQGDNGNYCECENCVAFENAHGGAHSAPIINFVNQIADAVKAAGYGDNVAIDTFAYLYSTDAPEGIVPRDNVIVRMCTIEVCNAEPLDECESNAEILGQLQDWSKICDRLYIWDYCTDFANVCTVYPNFGVIQRNLQIYYENGVKGVYEEGNYFMNSSNVEFGELRTYMIAKFLQDPYRDYDEVVNGFLEAYYGENAAPYMRKIIDMFVDNAGNSVYTKHLGIYTGIPDTLIQLTDTELYYIDALWEEAKEADGLTEQQISNINRSEISWRWYKMDARRDEFSYINADRFDEREKLYHEIVALGVTTTAEFRGGLDDDPIYCRYAKVNWWGENVCTEEERAEILEQGPKFEKALKIIFPGNYLYKILSIFKKIVVAVTKITGC